MKRDAQLFTVCILLIAITGIYRVIPYEMRPEWLGGPQLALALFAGSVVKNRALAFLLPLLSMLLGDVVMQVLYVNGQTNYPGFYTGQLLNYGLFALLTVVGFFVNHKKPASILGGMLAAPTLYFLLSNFAVWVSGGGLHRPKTPAGLLQCYADALPFYGSSLLTMLVFGTVLFGSYYLWFQARKAAGVQA